MEDFVICERKLESHESEALKACLESLNSKPVEVKTLSSFDVSSINEMPSGMTMSFPANDVVDPNVLSDRLFSVRCISKILKDPDMASVNYSASFFEDASKRKELHESIAQYAEYPIDLSVRSDITGKETDEWDHELGGPGSFVSIMSSEQQGRRRTSAKDWFFVAQGTAPQAVKQFKEKVRLQKPTYNQFFNDAKWKKRLLWLKSACERNVTRNLVVAAQAMGVPIKMVQDVSAFKDEENGGQPYRAVPEWTQTLYDVQKTVHNNQDTVTFYFAATPREQCRQMLDNNFFVLEGPYHGLIQFPLANSINISALPTNLGRHKNDADVKEMIKGDVNEQKEIQERARFAVWDGKDALKHHPELSDHAYKQLGEDFKNDMKKAGWNPEHHVRRMIPVMLKLWNPDLRRPN